MENIFCHNCGQKITNSKFCGHCGTKIKHKNKDPQLSVIKESGPYEEASDSSSNEVNLHLALLHNEAKKAANMMMWGGIGWIAAGLVITGITYAMADEGGTYYVFWGLSIYGAYRLIKGVYYRIAPHRLIEEALAHVNDQENKSGE